MILISIKSGLMDVKRQYEKEKDAEKYLHKVKELHDMHRESIMGKRPLKRPGNHAERIEYEKAYRQICPLKIEIINTEAAQLSLTPLLIPTK